MIWARKSNPRPLGVPLDEVAEAINATNLKASLDGDSLIVKHPKFTTHVDVVRPANSEAHNDPIRAVVQIRSELPQEISAYFSEPETTAAMNSLCTLGALTVDNGKFYVGSRLTIFEAEDAWSLHFPLILFSVIGSTDTLLGAIRRSIGQEDVEDSASAWTSSDIEYVENYLSKRHVCNTGGVGLTAEFGLRDGPGSAIAGDNSTALWQLIGDQPHPEAGGGLFCLLQMPHQLDDEARLDRLVVQLNQMEMAPHDLPPHFGAWCRGQLGNNPAYVSFLPNALHAQSGIALNVSIWATVRARWANAMLASMGIRA